MTSLHADELPIDLALVRGLVDGSFPEYAGRRLQPLASSGSSNALYRLGDDLLVRLPRQPGGSATIHKEARWTPVIGPRLTAPVPEVVGVGEPGLGYPEAWSVVRWIEGSVPPVPWREAEHGSSRHLAEDLAGVVRDLRAIEVPADAISDPALTSYRGGALADLDDYFRESLAACRGIDGLDLDLAHVAASWESALAAERRLEPAVRWLHSDLLAENLLVRDGRLAAVLDLGGLGVGDPSVDLIVAWEVLDAAGRQVFRGALDLGDDAWAKARGWALLIAVITFPYYWHTMPGRCSARVAMAAAVLAES